MVDRRRLLLLAPLGVAVAGGGAFWAMLRGMARGTFDPRGVPSPIVGQKMQPFDLPAQAPGEGFSSADFGHGKPVLLNFFASWCAPCLEEHPALMALSKAGMPIWGIAYKDGADKVAQFIRTHGDPFARIARDEHGLVAIDWGVSGVPESFLVDGEGVVRWHWPLPMDGTTIEQQLQPAWRAVAGV